MQRNLVSATSFVDRHVRQGIYWVLHAVAMPSILIEFGFIDNPEEEAKLMDPAMQKKMAEAVASAFQEYKNEMEGKVQTTSNDKGNDKAGEVKNDKVDKKADDKKADDKKADVVASSSTNKASSNNVSSPSTTNSSSDNNSGVRFKVQIYATPDKIAVTDKRFAGLTQVDCYYENSLWKYTSGNVTTYEEAQKLHTAAKAKFPDAFIISFQDGKKIPVAEARKLAQ